MEVAIGSTSGPFQREVHEWQHVDPNTGALLSGRIEADRWIDGPLNKYGKVIDSKNISTPNGIQHSQRKQLEILKAHTSSGSLQVVRAQTVQTSSSRWSSSGTKAGSFLHPNPSKSIEYYNDNNNNNKNSDNSNNSSTPNNYMNNIASIPHMASNNNHSNNNNSTSNNNNFTSLIQQQHETTQDLSQQLHDVKMNTTELQHILRPTDISTISNVGVVFRRKPATTLSLSRVPQNHLHGINEREILLNNSNSNNNNDNNNYNNSSHSSLSRGKSVSNEDLTIENPDINLDENGEPIEWKRVSKLRRSLQYPKSSTSVNLRHSSYFRPPDLPANSVSVQRIKQELENGRRLSTVMRNNHIDLVALENILNGDCLKRDSKSTSPSISSSSSSSTTTDKRVSFITAESLKEIRGKLRKLSDESLYKDDMSRIEEEKVVNVRKSGLADRSAIKVAEPIVKQDSEMINTNSGSVTSSRSKYKNLSSTNDWYLRRKSYGFEKMLPQSDSSSKMLESTDSGIGRSSEISNWSANESSAKGTVVALNEINSAKKNNSSSLSITFTNGSHDIKHSNSRQMMNLLSNGNCEDEIKRHSIAVDEAKYVRDNLRRVFESKTSIHLNGMYSDDSSSQTNNSDDNRDSRKNAKRVEFCKTEVHFAAESGRVNIVETDGKPPPTNNFRRRRRISSGSSNISASYLEAINSGVPVTHFGDIEKTGTAPAIPERGTKLTSTDIATTTAVSEVISSATAATTTKEYDEIPDHDDENTSIRGILKNKPIKPRPYHLGENIESSESLWGVRLRPVSNDFTNWRSSLCNNDETNEISTSPPTSSSPPSSSSLNKQQNINNYSSSSSSSNNSNSSSNINNDRDKTTNSITNQQNDSTSMNLGYSTKVNLSSNPSSFSWNNKDEQPHENPKITVKLRGNEKKSTKQDDKETTKICIDMSTSSSSSPTTDLKSTSLIMQTIRSSGHFDELMKNLEQGTDKLNRLSISDASEHNKKYVGPPIQPKSALKLISQMNAITKSNSANSLVKDTSKLSLYDQNSFGYGKKYSSSLDGGEYNRDYDSELDSTDSTKLYVARKHSLQSKIEENYKIISNYSNSSFSSCSEKYDFGSAATRGGAPDEFGDDDETKIPIAAPRMKKIGPANVLSQQLSQLRRLYEAADQDSDDSAKADEEVKHYLGNLISMEERTSELSGSWSRVKAKRSVMKKEEIKNIESGKASEYKYSNGHKDLIHSNVMSIALHSPTSSQKRSTSPIPIAKPRSVVAPITTKTMIGTVATPTATKQQHHQTVVRKLNPNEKDGDRNSLKLASGGPRKLREHELSYFGVSVPKSGSSSSLQQQPTTIPNNTLINHKPLTTATAVLSGSKNLSMAKLNNTNSSNNDNFLKKWQLTHDKPDLLRHSPNNNNPGDYSNIKSSSSTSSILTTTSSSSLVKMNTKMVETGHQHDKKMQKTKLDDEPVYENIRKIRSYERKHDLKRDEMILNELSKTADQILSSISGYTDDDSNEENKKISANHKKATNLHTIDEHKSISQKTMHSKGVQVSTPAFTGTSTSLRRKSKTPPDSRHHSQQHHHHHHHRSRVSSASSNESLPRGSFSTVTSAVATTTSQKTKRLCHKQHESQSADLRSGSSMNSVKSITRRKASDRMHRTSSRDTLNSNNASSSEDLQSSMEIPRRPRRIRTKDKSESQQIAKKSETKSSTMRSGSADKTLSSHRNTNRSTSSSHRNNDHGPVIKDNKGSILIEQQQKHRIKSGVVTTTPSSSSATAATSSTPTTKRGTTRSSEKVWK